MRFINIHTHQYSNDSNVLELVNQYPSQVDQSIPYYSVGIHPWHINIETLEAELQIVREQLALPNCIALGECGLDKKVETPFELQQQVFERQLALAEEFNKPVIVHCVAAFQKLATIKKQLSVKVPMIIHGFSKSAELAKQMLDNGFYLSFGKYLLRNPGLERTFLAVPVDRFLLETDSIEEGIDAVYELAANYKKQTVEQVCQQTETNFSQIFKFNL
jgi:TatD DNase family protein